jgi:hypothetical protein
MRDVTEEACMRSAHRWGVNKQSIESAISMLKDGGYAIIMRRVNKLSLFIMRNPGQEISVVHNNSYWNPPRKRTALAWSPIGDDNEFRYQIWAVIYRQR